MNQMLEVTSQSGQSIVPLFTLINHSIIYNIFAKQINIKASSKAGEHNINMHDDFDSVNTGGVDCELVGAAQQPVLILIK